LYERVKKKENKTFILQFILKDVLSPNAHLVLASFMSFILLFNMYTTNIY